MVIFQNNNELRSTGGYITSVFEVELGRLGIKAKRRRVEDELTKHKHVEAPKIIQEMLYDRHLTTWTFRDANYDPDFRNTAKKLIEFYHLVFPKKTIDGILAINYTFVENWLGKIGGIKLAKRRLDQHNLFKYLSASTSDIDRHDLVVLKNRKSILGRLAKVMIIKTLLKPWKWPRLFLLSNGAFQTKDLQFYSRQLKSESDFKLNKGEDFLAVIENNYLGLKSNRYLTRRVVHHSQLGKQSVLSRVTVQWEHLGTNDYPLSGNYRGQVRFYLPKQAEVLDQNFNSSQEGDFLVLSKKIFLKPGQMLDMTLSYRLPISFFKEGEYLFKFFKQSGVQRESFKKTFSSGLNHLLKDKKEVYVKDYLSVKKDLSLKIQFEKNLDHPRIYSHEIVGPQKILVKFNQPIDYKKSKLSIHKKEDPESIVKIKSLSTLNQGRWLLIETVDLPEEKEIFYTLRLQDIFNTNEIAIHPNPRQVSVVYRPQYFKAGQRQLSPTSIKPSPDEAMIKKALTLKKAYEKNAHYPPGHYYSPIALVDELKKNEARIWKDKQNKSISDLDLNVEEQLSLAKHLSRYYKDLPFTEQPKKELRYHLNNPWYAYADGILLYGMMRHHQPKNIIEIGSGFSSALMLDVNDLFLEGQTQLVFIEPYPDRLKSLMKTGDDQDAIVAERPIQEIPLEIFDELQAGDILFIDSSHVVKCGSDLQHILFEILPTLKPGVLIHFHDIFYPFEYPKKWVYEGRNWNENYFIRALLMGNHQYKIKLFSHYLYLHHPQAFESMPLCKKNPGGSLWLEKTI